jgi:predicted metal-dependent hydrolase
MQVVVPIFFSKEDVDGAVATAHAARLNSQVESFLAQAATHKKEYDSHLARFAEAKNESDKKLARELAERSQQEEASCRAQARLVSEQPKPAVRACLRCLCALS